MGYWLLELSHNPSGNPAISEVEIEKDIETQKLGGAAS
jgi:hypothetical protein